MSYRTKDQAASLRALTDRPVKLIEATAAEQELIIALAHDHDNTRGIYAQCVAAGIEDRDFSVLKGEHHAIWMGMKLLQKRGTPITQATLLRELRRSQVDESVDYEVVLRQLYSQEPRWDLVETSIEEVRQAGIQRYIQIESLQLLHGASRLDAGMISSRLSKLSEQTIASASESIDLSGGIDAYRAHIHHTFSRSMQGQGATLRTPLKRLNRVFAGGFEPGRYILIGGPPKAGKTKLATYIAWHLMRDCAAVVDWFSTEMTLPMMIAALMGPAAKVPFYQAYSAEPTNDDVTYARGQREDAVAALGPVINRGVAAITAAPGTFHYRMVGGDVSVQAIESTIKRRVIEMEARGDKRPYIAFVDYVQGVPSGERLGSERDEIRATSMMLNAIAKRLNVPVVGIYHTGRGSDAAYGSSQLEKDADITVVIKAGTEQDKRPDDWRAVEATFNRHDQCRRCELRADLSRAIFEEWNDDNIR